MFDSKNPKISPTKKKKSPLPFFTGAPYFPAKNSQFYNFEAQKLVGFVCTWFLLFPFWEVFSGWKSRHVRLFQGRNESLPHFFYHRGASRRVSRCRWFRWHAQSIRPPGHLLFGGVPTGMVVFESAEFGRFVSMAVRQYIYIIHR